MAAQPRREDFGEGASEEFWYNAMWTQWTLTGMFMSYSALVTPSSATRSCNGMAGARWGAM